MSEFMIVWHFAWIASWFLLLSRVSWSRIYHFKNHCQNIFSHGLQCTDHVLLLIKLSYETIFILNIIFIGDFFDELLKST